MNHTKPRALKPGATLGIISPASLAKQSVVEQGLANLQQLGYRTKLFPHALDRGPLNHAGTIADRLSDLHAAYADPEVDAILCTRGGWGCAELLPGLDRALIEANPKPLIGYSDVTALHVWLLNELGRTSFQGPMAASDFAKPCPPDLASWHNALTTTHPWHLGPEQGLRTLRQALPEPNQAPIWVPHLNRSLTAIEVGLLPPQTVAEGPLTGGCLSIVVEALGTPYAPKPTPGILFLEDTSTKPYQWARMLTHLQQAGLLAFTTGIVFGDMRSCSPPEEDAELDQWLLHALRDFAGPIAIGLRSGHVDGGNITLPFGVRVRLDLFNEGNPRMDFLEAAVAG